MVVVLLLLYVCSKCHVVHARAQLQQQPLPTLERQHIDVMNAVTVVSSDGKRRHEIDQLLKITASAVVHAYHMLLVVIVLVVR